MIFEVYENNKLVMVLSGSKLECSSRVTKSQTLKEVTTINTSVPYYDVHKYLKEIKEAAVNKLTVTTTSGKVFDGDEKSQDRMARAINIANITGDTETQWKLADNTIVMVTLDELKEALMLAGQEMSKIWLEQ